MDSELSHRPDSEETGTTAHTLPKLRVAFDDSVLMGGLVMRALRRKFDVIEDKEHPEVAYYSNFGWKHLSRKDCIKIFVNSECVAPDFNVCDYAVSCHRINFDNRNLYFPPAFFQYLQTEVPELPPITPDMAKRKFCSFLYSQRKDGEGSQLRAVFCEKLMQYAHVDCPGKVLHNMDAPELATRHTQDWNASKIRFIGNYKFNIAFENSSSCGYITEKLTDCFVANTVPIYWGSEGDVAPFPKEAMICAHDYPDLDSLLARIKEVNENDEEYLRILAANPLRHGFRLSRKEDFEAFIWRTADVSRRPNTCDPVAHSDVAVWKAVYNSRMVLIVVLFRLCLSYFRLRFRLLFLHGEQHDTVLVRNSRTYWLIKLVIHQLRKG